MAQHVDQLRRGPELSLSARMLAGHTSLTDFLDSRQCFICVSSLREVRAECGHLLGCRQCTQQLRDCPFCRRRIHWTIQCQRPSIRNVSVDGSDITSSLLSTGTAKTCPPRLLYHDLAPKGDPTQMEMLSGTTTAPLPRRKWQEEGVCCDICHTRWPDLLQW